MITVATKRRPRRAPSGLELPRTDGRTLTSRPYRALCVAFKRELGGQLSVVDQNLVRQAAKRQNGFRPMSSMALTSTMFVARSNGARIVEWALRARQGGFQQLTGSRAFRG